MRGINFEVKRDEIVLRKKLAKDETYKVSDSKRIFTLSIYKKPQWTRGVTSYCEDGKHCLFLDYDDTCRWVVETELEELSEDEGCPFYLFKTKEEVRNKELVGNYHAVALVKNSAGVISYILQYKTSCDSAFPSFPTRTPYRSWVLRIANKTGSGKPEFVKMIFTHSGRVIKEISEAHLKFFESMYDLPKVEYINKDGLTKVFFNDYETRI